MHSDLERPQASKSAKKARQVLALILTGLVLIALADLWSQYAAGGHHWKQTDWLINVENQWVRRGLLGSALIRLSDALSADLLTVTVLVQAAFILLAAAGVYATLSRAIWHVAHSSVALLPPVYQVMAASRFDGLLTKELIAIAGLGLICLSPGVGTLLLSLGFFAHEGLVFFLPAGLALLWRFGACKHWMVVMILSGLTAFAYAFVFRTAEDSALICAPLLQRGLGEHLCSGPISYLALNLIDFTKSTIVDHLSTFRTLVYLAAWSSSVVLLALLWRNQDNMKIGLACLVPVLPLFFLAEDYGRWFSMAFTSAVLIASTYRIGAPRPILAIAVAAGSMVVTFGPVGGVYFSGIANRIVKLWLPGLLG